MSKRLLSAALLIAMLVCAYACQPKTETNSNAVNRNTNQAPQNTPSSQPEVKAEATTSTTASSLSTPTDTYKTGYNARKNKDIETLKSVLSKDAIDFLTEVGKDEKKTLDDQLKDLAAKPQAATADTRNEKINGNRASLEYLDEDGKWKTMDFIKEGNDWKIDIPKAP